ncbi:MAG: hypothetical protein HQ530_02685 [Parcubacteria group bacterium]|nr:hypothetical protein [Parcubacteria group bacterium]
MSLNREIDKFLDIFTEAWCVMDFDTFADTISWAAYDPLIANAWTKRILQMIADCQAAGLKSREVAALFPGTSHLRVLKGFDLWIASYADVPRTDREKIFAFYSSLLHDYCLEDPYGQAKNIIHTPEEVSSALKNLQPAMSTIAKALGRAVNACYHLGQAMYSDMNPSIVYDNYGPYEITEEYDKNHILAIKEFNRLKCPELWPETAELPCNSIRILYVYKNVKMTIDPATHVVFVGDLINNLQYYRLEVDGKERSTAELNEIAAELEKMAVAIFQKFQALNFERKKKKYYHTKAYSYCDLYKKLRQDWRPAAEILQEARGRKLHTPIWSKNAAKQKELIRNTMDPRTDFRV